MYSRNTGEKTAVVGEGGCGPKESWKFKFKLGAYQDMGLVGCEAWAPPRMKMSPVSFGKRDNLA